MRTDYNYEGRSDHIDNTRRRKRENDKAVNPYRYDMMTHYDTARKATLL
jgi:hypothetical protein